MPKNAYNFFLTKNVIISHVVVTNISTKHDYIKYLHHQRTHLLNNDLENVVGFGLNHDYLDPMQQNN